MNRSRETRRARRQDVARLDVERTADRFALREVIVTDVDADVRQAALLRLDGVGEDGMVASDGRSAGTYVHGLFADDRQRAAWLARLGAGGTMISYAAQVEETLDRLAAHLADCVDLDRLLALAR